MVGQNTLALKKFTIQSFLLLIIKHTNQPKPPKTTRNQKTTEKLAKTIHNKPKPPTKSQNHLQSTKNNHNNLKPAKRIHSELELCTSV